MEELKGEPVKDMVRKICPTCNATNDVIHIKYPIIKRYQIKCWNCGDLFEGFI